jgi:hypothetical protein
VSVIGTVAEVNATLATLSYLPAANFSGSDTLTVATTDNGNTGAGGALTDTDTVAITVRPVADAPTLTVTTPAGGAESAPIPLSITAALTDTDGSESLGIEIIGVPSGVTFNRGLDLGSTWRFSPSDLAGLAITVADGPATLNLQVNAISTEAATGQSATTSRPLVVVVTNAPPTATLTNGGPVNEGSTGTVSFGSPSDASAADAAGVRYAYDFDNDGKFDVGDGTYAGSVSSSTATVPASFLDDGPGNRTVRGRIIDKDGGFTDVTTTIKINDVAPTATLTASGRLIERQPVTVTFSNQFDPSAADTAAGFLYSYDFDGDGVFEITDSPSPSATFTPPTEGSFNVRGRIKDKDGGSTDLIVGGAGTSGGALLVANVDVYAVGAGAGMAPMVNVYDQNRTLKFTTLAYSVDFTGGVNVATADVNGDGVPDIITGAGKGGAPLVNVFNGVNGDIILSFYAYDPGFRGGVNVAGSDLNGDGFADIIAGAGDGGAPHIAVFSGKDGHLMKSFMAFEDSFRGGVQVAAGDVFGTGRMMIVAGAGMGGAPRVVIIDPTTAQVVNSFFAFDPSFRGGVNVATGDIDLDGKAEIIFGSGPGGGPEVGIVDATTGTPQQTFFGFDESFRGGVRVASSDLNGDRRADLVLASGPGVLPQASGSVVRTFNGQTLKELDNFYPFDPLFSGGVYVG